MTPGDHPWPAEPLAVAAASSAAALAPVQSSGPGTQLKVAAQGRDGVTESGAAVTEVAKAPHLRLRAGLIVLSAADSDSPGVVFAIVGAPLHGTLSPLSAPNCAPAGAGSTCTVTTTYTPTIGYSGPDSLTFKASDGLADSNVAGVGITVQAAAAPANLAPVSNALNVATALNTPKLLTLSAADADNATLTFAVVFTPSHGTLSPLSAPVCTPAGAGSNCTSTTTYTPTAGYTGGDAFSFKANDGAQDSNVATVSITVTSGPPPAQAPTAASQSVTTAFNTAKGVSLGAADSDSPALTFSIVTNPGHGTLSALGAPACMPAGSGSTCASAVTYTPTTGYSGPDSFTFRASDGGLLSNVATVSITVGAAPPTSAPVATPQSASTGLNTAKPLSLAATDTDSTSLSFVIVSPPSHGALTPLAAPVCLPAGSGSSCTAATTYTPTTGYSGPDSFSFKANDGTQDSNVATVSITVSVAPPSATHFSVTAPGTATAGTPFSFVVTALDATNATVTGYTGTVHFTSTDAGVGHVLPGDYTFVTGDNGSHTFNATLVTPGSQTITATDLANNTVTGTSGPIVVSAAPADLTITKTHAGSFVQGDTGKTYTITVTNAGAGATTGTVTVTDTLPAGLTPTNATGTGWSCGIVAQTMTCTRSDALNPGGSYPAITLTVNVSNSATTVTNTASVAGGGETNTANNSANDPTTIAAGPDLTISKTHVGSFTQGDTGKTYTITVTNSGTTASTASTVTVADVLPTGLTPTLAAGTGWSCGIVSQTVTCTRADSLAPAASYPSITVTFDVSASATTVTNTATVPGGGDVNNANNSANDPTTINAGADLTIGKSHAGNFVQGDTGKTYTITVTNSGTGDTSGTVTVNDTLPAGLTPTNAAGTGWSCGIVAQTVTCTRSDVLNSSASYQAITLTVDVSPSAAAALINSATVSGGGETNVGNDTSNDPTTIDGGPDLTINKTHLGNFAQGQTGATYTITVTNSGASPSTTATVTVSDTLPADLTPTNAAGTGWSCGIVSQTATCTRNDSLGAGLSYPAITLTVDVSATSGTSATNTVSVAGGGDINNANNSASDPTTITIPLPVAAGDAFTATGNIKVAVPTAITANDTPHGGTLTMYGPTSGTATTVVDGVNTVTTSNGGTVLLQTNGTFTYDPPAGFTGTDHFFYVLTNGTGNSDFAGGHGDVALTVSNMVWFIDNNAGVCSSQCGRLTSPFNSTTAFQAVNDGIGAHPAAGQPIFIYESATSYTGGVTLLATQKLLGQDATPNGTTLASLTGVSLDSNSVATPVTNTGGNKVTIVTNDATSDVTLGSGNTVRGLTLSNSGTALTGSGFGTLTLNDVDINNGGAGGGNALNLTRVLPTPPSGCS